MAESDYYGRIGIGWPNHPGRIRMGWPNHHGRIRIGWPNHPGRNIRMGWPNHPNGMAESYALVAAVRNLAYHRHHLVLGASDASAHAWLG